MFFMVNVFCCILWYTGTHSIGECYGRNGENMQIFVDADACPVVKLVERVAKEYHIPVTLLCDTNHILNSDYSTVKVIGARADAVDFALINLCSRGDVVVTQDYGVAAMALGKGAYGIYRYPLWILYKWCCSYPYRYLKGYRA